MLTQMPTPAIYRTTITHSRQTPVHHSFEYRSYSWYVDVDDLPRLPRWLRPFARFRTRPTGPNCILTPRFCPAIAARAHRGTTW